MRPWIKYLLVGAVSFWGPQVVVVIITGRTPTGYRQLLNLMAASMSACLTYLILLKLKQPRVNEERIALWMLVGIWALGMWFQLLSATLQGFGAHGMKSSDWIYFLVYSLAPFPSLLLYGWDGSFFAVLIVTLFLFVADSLWEKPRNSAVSD